MSWPGDESQGASGSGGPGGASGGPGGRGRRRRSEASEEYEVEDPYVSGEYQGGAGRRGTGEFARPAEYVQPGDYASDGAQGYSQGYGAAQPYEYEQPQGNGESQQPQGYAQSQGYAQPQQGYDQAQQQGYAQPAYVRPDPYVQPAYAPQEPQGYGQQDSYEQDAYATSPYVTPPPVRPNLNSSGFYPVVQPQPVVEPRPAPVPVPMSDPDPDPEPDPVVRPEPSVPQQMSTSSTTSFRTMPGSTEAKAAARAPVAEGTMGGEDDVSDWLTFVESRADQRQERGRKFRFRLIALGVVLAVLAGGAGLWYFLTSDGKAAATETTVLFQLKDASGDAVGNVVLVASRGAVAGKADPTGKGAALLIPSQMSIVGTGLENQPFGGAMGAAPADPLNGTAAPAASPSVAAIAPAGKEAVSGLLGVDVDGVWSVDEYSFATFIDSIGQIVLDTDATITGKDGKPLVQQGTKVQLTGAQAVLYATYRATGEPADRQLARFGQVVKALLTKIPPQQSTTEKLLNLQATVPDPALPNNRLAAILSALAGEVQGNRFQVEALPLRTDGSDTLDLQAAAPIVKQLLGGAVHAKDNSGLPRVAVYDATGRQETVSSRTMAAAKLQGGGYTPIDSGAQQATDQTVVEIPNDGQHSLGSQIAMTLGLPDTAVKVVKMDTTLADAIVVLGKDWTSIGGLPADGPTATAAPTSGGSDATTRTVMPTTTKAPKAGTTTTHKA